MQYIEVLASPSFCLTKPGTGVQEGFDSMRFTTPWDTDVSNTVAAYYYLDGRLVHDGLDQAKYSRGTMYIVSLSEHN